MNKKASDIIWGILLIVGAVVLILSQLGRLGGLQISVWKVFATLVLLAIAIKSLFNRSFAGILFPIALFCIMFDEILGITALTPWTVLLAALLFSIALSMIFKSWRIKSCCGFDGCRNHHQNENFSNIVDEQDGEKVYSHASFGGTVKYVNSDNLKKVHIKNAFGATKMYFDKAVIQGEEAEIYIESSFGAVELFIPKEWKIINKVNVSFGAIEEKNTKNSGMEEKKVYLTGALSFGAVEILYV